MNRNTRRVTAAAAAVLSGMVVFAGTALAEDTNSDGATGPGGGGPTAAPMGVGADKLLAGLPIGGGMKPGS